MADVLTSTPAIDVHDLGLSARGRNVVDRVETFISEEVEPAVAPYDAAGAERPDRWTFAPRQLEILNGLKAKAKARGLWNLFLAGADDGLGLSNLDYAYAAFEMGKTPMASESMNCSPPDTGNMEVLSRVGTPAQKDRWLRPLLDGEIRSAFAMTEPEVASSDARNIRTRAEPDGRDLVITGEKYFVSGAGDPRCAVMLVAVETDPDGSRDSRQSLVLVPMETPGVEVVGPMHVFGHDAAPHGHMHVRLTDVRVPRDNVLLGLGRGFEIAQLRLGAGRIHGCMRAIGAAERALSLMVERGIGRQAFGKPLVELGKNMELVSRSRIDIEAMRLMVLRAAKAMDVESAAEARVWVSAVKAMVPERVCRIIDEAIQVHGATGLSTWTPLAEMYVAQRAFRIGDGPDEVHHRVVARAEVAKHRTAQSAVR